VFRETVVGVLDLRQFQRPREERTIGWGSGGGIGIEGRTIHKSPALALSLKLAKNSYFIDEEYTFELMVSNISGKPFTIPWEPDWTKVAKGFNDPPPGYLEAFLRLDLMTDPPPKGHLVEFSLLGSQLARGSLKTLGPGESVKMIGMGRWTQSSVRGIQIEAGRPTLARIQASWSVLYGLTDPLLEREVFSQPISIELGKR
jgi:hypothetical protein